MSEQKAVFILILLIVILAGCGVKIKQQEDKIYSRHLQQHIKLTIISTPLPDKKQELNLLLLNDGQDVGQLNLVKVLDSLLKDGSIQPLVVVAIHANNRQMEYGVSGHPDYKGNGARADKYSSFISNELYDFIKKKSGVRKFKNVVLAGFSMGGLSAMDVGWDHADKIDKVGIFSGSFWFRDKDTAAADYSKDLNRVMLKKISTSRKRPTLKYWFFAGELEEKSDRDKDGVMDVIDDTRDLIKIIKNKNIIPEDDITYVTSPYGMHDYQTWARAFPSFLVWAFSK